MKKQESKIISVRGCGKYDLESGEFLFQPQGRGEPVQKNVRTVGLGGNRSKFYETEGEKDASVVLHLVAKKKSADPIADLFDDFRSLTRCEWPVMPVMPMGRRLHDTSGLNIVADEAKREVKIFATLSFEEAARPVRPVTLLTYFIERALRVNEKLFMKEGR